MCLEIRAGLTPASAKIHKACVYKYRASISPKQQLYYEADQPSTVEDDSH